MQCISCRHVSVKCEVGVTCGAKVDGAWCVGLKLVLDGDLIYIYSIYDYDYALAFHALPPSLFQSRLPLLAALPGVLLGLFPSSRTAETTFALWSNWLCWTKKWSALNFGGHLSTGLLHQPLEAASLRGPHSHYCSCLSISWSWGISLIAFQGYKALPTKCSTQDHVNCKPNPADDTAQLTWNSGGRDAILGRACSFSCGLCWESLQPCGVLKFRRE